MTALKTQTTSLVKQGAFDEAIALIRAAIEQDDGCAETWALLSHTQEIVGDLEAAIQAADRAIALAPNEPAYWFQRGWLHLLVDAAQNALGDMQKTLTLSRSLNRTYYIETAAFLAAESLRRLHRYAEALAQCAEVRDDFSLYVGAPLSKADLLKNCRRALRHTEAIAA